MESKDEANIEHHPERAQFGATLNGARGRLDYRLAPGVMTIVHTEVDPALEGKGVAGALVRAALEHARASGLKVEPVCDYASSYMQRHPETMALRR
jgi:predicted GNAT family acetyltransferase